MEDSEKISGDNGAGCATLQMCLVPTIYVRGSAVVSVPNPVLDILTEKARRTGENVLTTKRDQGARERSLCLQSQHWLGEGRSGDPAAFLAMRPCLRGMR